MSVSPGWYEVAGTTDVRWWDGTSFRDVTLVNDAPHYRLSWGVPAGNYLFAGIAMTVIAIAISLLASDDVRTGATLFSAVTGVLAVLFFGLTVVAMKTRRLPAPTGSPVSAAATQPLPGTTEPGVIEPGWYAGPAHDKPRWWTGARWSEYLLAYGRPFPAAGQAQRVQRGFRRWFWVTVIIVVAAIGAAVITGMLDNEGWMILAVTVAVLAFATALSLRFGERRAMRPFVCPTQPPTTNRIA